MMDAYVIGAMPPYNYLLGGKLISYVIASDELRTIYKNKYAKVKTIIKKREASDLALLVTTSLYGRNSSQYNRLKYGKTLLYKPIGMTSHDVVKVIRQGTGIRRAGHTGTLDPRASGVLVVLIGPAVRLSEFLSASDKRYQAILRFGVATDTYDTEGKQVGETKSVDHITEDDFQNLLRRH